MLPFCRGKIRVRRVIVRSQGGGFIGVGVCRPPNPSISRECMFGARFKSQRRLPSGRSVRRSRRDHRAAGSSRACGYGIVEGLPVWPNRDPLAEMGGINLYGFVRNAPTQLVDLFGLDSLGLWDRPPGTSPLACSRRCVEFQPHWKSLGFPSFSACVGQSVAWANGWGVVPSWLNHLMKGAGPWYLSGSVLGAILNCGMNDCIRYE
jgi:hypothetical protein